MNTPHPHCEDPAGAPARPPVLLIGNFLAGAPASRAVGEDLAERLRARGWQVLTTSRQPRRALRLLDMLLTAWRRRREYAVAHVEVFSGRAFRWAEAACWTLRRARRPYALTLHGGNLPRFAERHPRRVRRLLAGAAAVTVPSRYLQERLQPYRADLRLLPNPVDLSRCEFRLRDRPEPRLVWVRAFERPYNPSLAPRVLARLREEFPEIRLAMVGPDKGDGSLARMRAEAERLGVAERIETPGGVPKADVPRWLDQADVFLNTTNVDNTPVSVLEALACGLPVVSTDVGGLPYLLEHERTGLLVPPDDGEALAAAVRRVLTEPDLARRLSQAGRAAAEPCDWSVVLPQWEALLQQIASDGRRAASSGSA